MGDDDVFEIHDHTNASALEKLVSKIESVLRTWNLQPPGGGDIRASETSASSSAGSSKHSAVLTSSSSSSSAASSTTGCGPVSERRSEMLSFRQQYFRLSFYRAEVGEGRGDGSLTEAFPAYMDSLLDSRDDFWVGRSDAQGHVVQNWYGLGWFLLVSPVMDNCSAECATVLLSALTMATQNTQLDWLPALVTMSDSVDGRYCGYTANHACGTSTRFDSEWLRYVEPDTRNLSTLLDMFVSKVAAPDPSMTVAVRFTYTRTLLRSAWLPASNEQLDEVRKQAQQMGWKYALGDLNEGSQGGMGGNALDGLLVAGADAYGPRFDPIQEVQLMAVWPERNVNEVTDNAVHSDLNPFDAPVWAVQSFVDPELDEGRLTCKLRDLHDVLAENRSEDTMAGLRVGTHRKVSASRVLQQLQQEPSAQEVHDVMVDLFASEQGMLSSFDAQEWVECTPKEELCMVGKTSHPTTLLARLSQQLCQMQNASSMALLWTEFVSELRWYWEHGTPIPFVERRGPSFDSCLLQQKLQLLNICIGKRIAKKRQLLTQKPIEAEEEESGWEALDLDVDDEQWQDALASSSATATDVIMVQPANPEGGMDGDDVVEDDDDEDDDDDDDDDAFVLASDSLEGFDFEMEDQEAAALMAEHDDGRGQGRRRPLFMKSMASGHELFAPRTQDAQLMTEDMAEQQQMMFAQLGSDEQGSKVRARLQAEFLRSDMEAFKAANPGCTLGDFVRWYSPRDWIAEEGEDKGEEAEEVRGHLSVRMTEEGNIWEELWTSAKARPIESQAPLFDHNKEAEAVLHYLETCRPVEVLQDVFRVACNVQLHVLAASEASRVPAVAEQLGQLREAVANLPVDFAQDHVAYDRMCSFMGSVEMQMATANSLLEKLGGNSDLVQLLMSQDQVVLDDPSHRRVVKQMFMRASDYEGESMSTPNRKEYVVRSRAARPFVRSKRVGHRMHASMLDTGEMRVSMALSNAGI